MIGHLLNRQIAYTTDINSYLSHPHKVTTTLVGIHSDRNKLRSKRNSRSMYTNLSSILEHYSDLIASFCGPNWYAGYVEYYSW